MSTTQHPLTEDRAAELWDKHRGPHIVPSHEQGRLYMQGQTAMLRAAFDAGREHERATPADPHHYPRPWEPLNGPVCVGDEVRKDAGGITRTATVGRVGQGGEPWTAKNRLIGILEDGTWYVRRAAPTATPTTEKETPMPETPAPAEPLARTLLCVPAGHGAPRHDAGRIKPGDFVAQVDKSGSTRAGIAHRQSSDGDWWAKDGMCITWASRRADRPDALTVWPAPTPPAEEVKLPRTPGDVVRDIHVGLHRYEFAVKLHDGWRAYRGPEFAFHPDHEGTFLRTLDMDELTLPDGTRARRDGDRLIKVQEEEK